MNTASSPRLRLPDWHISTWLNSPCALAPASLRGKVVLLHAFQMLCPGCVTHGLPQAERVRQTFSEHDVTVIGLHTVFEHHAVMNVEALRAFVHEYRWSFPIGVDQPAGQGNVPLTMAAYGLRGTPSHIVLDRQGFVRLHQLGRIEDLALGGLIGQLLAEAPLAASDGGGDEHPARNAQPAADCTTEGCVPRR